MFSSLRQDSILYVLNKKEKPKLSIARVIGVSAPVAKYPTTFNNPMGGMETTVNITVEIDGANTEFKMIPSASSIYGDNNVVIAETKEAMSSEIESMKTNSENIIKSIDYHKSVIESCDNILVDLNPSIAREREQENKIYSLETKITGIEKVLSEMNELLKTNIKGKEQI